MAEQSMVELLSILKTRSWLEQDQEFTLASGRRSRYYIDSKMTTLIPEGARLVGEAVYAALQDDNIEAVGGLAHAAIPMVTAVVMASSTKARPIPGFYVREEAKEHGTQKIIEGFRLEPGTRVAIIDDVLTTGGSILKAIERAQDSGAIVVKVIVLVDRREGGAENLRNKGYDITALFEKFETAEGGGLRITEPALALIHN